MLCRYIEKALNIIIYLILSSTHRGRDHMVVDLQLPVQYVPITTKVVSSNPTQARCTRYNIM
jgi:hypothetical protein